MVDAFAELSALARRSGVDDEAITRAHGRFFDGNVQVKNAFAVAVLLAEIGRTVQGPRRLRRGGHVRPPGRLGR
jgi:hypothetical protein